MAAPVTVENHLKIVSSPFDLARLVGMRSIELARGAPAHVEPENENDKFAVIALREILAGYIPGHDSGQEIASGMPVEETESN